MATTATPDHSTSIAAATMAERWAKECDGL
jgi:hypothetical protein